MPPKIKINEKKVAQGVILLVSVTIVFLSLFGDKGLFELQALKTQEFELQIELKSLEAEQEEWLEKLNALRHSKNYYETLARERLGLIKSDEILIQLQD